MSLGKYSTFSDNPSSLLLFLSDFLTFLILSDLFHCFYRGNAWLIFKINVSLADKSDELNMKKITIAIDGFSSCGKSTMAKDLAREVGYIYIDSGAMYRAVTLYSIENGIFDGDIIDTEKLKKEIGNIHISFRLNKEGRPETYLNDVNVEDKIRSMSVSSKVSPISALDFVRKEMVAQQQSMGAIKGIVMDGRDIGTVVFPDAELKIFVTASADIRARRRYDELKAKGRPASYDEILKNVEERDYIDQNREVGPLRKAEDAILLDNSHMTIAEQKQWLAEQFQKATNG